MRNTKILIISIFALFLFNCEQATDDEINSLENANQKEHLTDSNDEILTFSKVIYNVDATQQGGQNEEATGSFTKFNFKTGTTTTDSTSWDIAFRGTTILVNGGEKFKEDEPNRTGNAGAYVRVGVYGDVVDIENNNFITDASVGLALPVKSGATWYLYNGAQHVITPIAGRILMFRTHDNNYVKMQVFSYYKDAPDNPDFNSTARYYTFKYTYQTKEILKL